jgi:hypothetical protein
MPLFGICLTPAKLAIKKSGAGIDGAAPLFSVCLDCLASSSYNREKKQLKIRLFLIAA